MKPRPFFVMLNTQNGGQTPMIDPEGNMMFYPTHDDAVRAARNSWFGEQYGFTIYGPGDGIQVTP